MCADTFIKFCGTRKKKIGKVNPSPIPSQSFPIDLLDIK